MYVYFCDDPHISCWKVVNGTFFGGGGWRTRSSAKNVKIVGRLSQSQKKIIGQIGGSLIVNVRAIDNDMILDWSRINQIFSVVLKW